MIKRFMFAFMAVLLVLSGGVYARLSPAMEIIAKRHENRKCVTSGTVLSLEKGDFDALVTENESINVISLPDVSEGVLSVSGVAVKEGQPISASELEFLRYSPAYGFEGKSEIVFECGGTTEKMSIYVMETANYAPETADMSIKTQRNIAVFKSALVADPDGDSFDIEIVRYPDHGNVRVTGDGQLVYRPLAGYTGKDSFSYIATDVYGNESKGAVVEVDIIKPDADIYFDDMQNHWAHNSAVKMAATGLMQGERIDGKLIFNPETDMTRGDFLALSLIMSGHENEIPFVSKTVFADDSMIPANIKSYVQYAYDKGIVSGYDNGDGSINFESTGSVTRAEAALITSKILGLDKTEQALPSYKDAPDIPAWASDAVSTLSSAGIISGDSGGDFNAGKNLSRAEGAEMICNVASYIEDKQNKEKEAGKKERNLFNLFGLVG